MKRTGALFDRVCTGVGVVALLATLRQFLAWVGSSQPARKLGHEEATLRAQRCRASACNVLSLKERESRDTKRQMRIGKKGGSFSGETLGLQSGSGEASRLLSSHTTVHVGLHTAIP